MIGQQFNRLRVLAIAPRVRKHNPRYFCVCDCGSFAVVDHYKMVSGHTKSCGCYKREAQIKRVTTHGMSKTSEYKAWVEAKGRVTNPKARAWKDYGGRGIQMCQRWLSSFDAFLEDMGPKPSPHHSLDRINVNGGYSPDNCRWATWTQQQNNKRRSRHIVYQGRTFNVSDLAKYAGVPSTTIQRHIFISGMSPEAAIDRARAKRQKSRLSAR